MIASGLGLAFVMGVAAHRLRISPIVGYLLAGIAVGPFTPGFVADQSLAAELAEIGVILLMFGVGLHFSLGDLLSVRKIAIPGAAAQMALATLLGMGARRPVRLAGRRRSRVRPRALGREHGRAAARPQERRLVEPTAAGSRSAG